MKCRRCGEELEIDSVFCDKCGTKVLVEPIENTSVHEFEEIEKSMLADNIINSELINNIKKEEPVNIDISDLAPDDLDDLMPKKKYTLLITLLVIIIIGIICALLYINLTKEEDKKKEEDIDYQQVINEYGKTIENVAADYLMENNDIESFDQIKDLVKYDKYKVSCNNIYINIDGSVYLADCSVNGKKVEEMYGMKKNILTKDEDKACNVTYDKKNNSLKFYFEGELLSIYECESEECSLYKNENFSYNSCLDKMTVIKDGDTYLLYDYKNAQATFDPFSEISSVKKDGKVVGFIAKDEKTEKYGYIDVRGNIKVKFEYDSLGIINNGKTYDYSYNVNNNVIVASKNKKYGVINLTKGDTVLDFKYDKVYLASKDKFVVKEEENYYYVGKDRMRIIDRGYKMIFAFDDLLVVNKDDKLYVVDFKGNNLVDDSISVSLVYNDNPSIGGVHGYNAYESDGNITIEVNKSEDDGYSTTKYVYVRKDKRIVKE